MNVELEEQCEIVYSLYPRKVGKRAALKAIRFALIRIHDGECKKVKTVKTDWEESFQYLVERTRAFSQSPAATRGTFTPHPSTWFNQSRYLDDPNEWWRVAHEPSQSNGVSHGWLK